MTATELQPPVLDVRPTRYWPGLDGLRGLALIVILLFHAEFSFVPGGFLSVTLFFTLSGFLITALVVEECDRSGSVSLTRFWSRRARRLLPASLVTLAFCIATTLAVSPVAQQATHLGDIRAAALDLANWRFVFRDAPYADVGLSPSPVQHYWTLSIEEQFYILFPVVAAFALRRSRTALTVVLGAIVAFSLFQQLRLEDIERVYYGTDTRIAEIAMGGLLALLWPRLRGWIDGHRGWVDGLGVAGLVASVFVWTQAHYGSDLLWNGGFVAVAVVSAAFVLGGVEGPRVSKALAWGPLVQLGIISYGVYLLHFPVYLIATEERLGLSKTPTFVVRIAITLVLAWLMYVTIERPIRRGDVLRPHVSTVVFVGGVVAILAATFVADRLVDEPAGAVEGFQTASAPALGDDVPTVLVVGDSTAANLGIALREWGEESGELAVAYVAAQGCTLHTGTSFQIREGYEFTPKGCSELFPSAGSTAVAESADAIVVMIGSSQGSDWIYPGHDGRMSIEDPEVQAGYREEMHAALDDLEQAQVPILWADVPPAEWDLEAFGEFLGGSLPGSGPISMNDPARTALINEANEEVLADHPLATTLAWTEVLAGPDGVIDPGVRFDGLHVDRAQVPTLAQTTLLAALVEAAGSISDRPDVGVAPAARDAWAGAR